MQKYKYYLQTQLCCDNFTPMGVVRKTKLVNILLCQFKHTKQAVSVTTLVKQLSGQMNKTTIYRILERLVGDGTLHSFLGKDGVRWYSKYSNNCSSLNHQSIHPHFQCKDCGKTECLIVDFSIPNIENYKIKTVSLLLTGSCEDCIS